MTPTPKLTCIIDDDTIYTKLLIKLLRLKKLCTNILVFKNGKEAIEYFQNLSPTEKRKNIPELIFLDINMPIMNGWEFLNEFKDIREDIENKLSLYVVSSSIDPMDFKKANDIELVDGYLSKPVSMSTFDQIFNTAC